MSQACDVLLLALGGSVFATWGLAVGTARPHVSCRQWIVLLGLGILPILSAHFIAAAGLRINLTPSMPLGVYRVVAIHPRSVQTGMLVAVCPPAKAAEIARRRRYLLRGVCAYETEAVLKEVVAVGGDEVLVTRRGLVVNGRSLPNSAALVADRAAHEVKAWPIGQQRLADRMLWVYADHRRSWDSRYWGPVSVSNVLAVVEPVLVLDQEQ